MKKLLLIAICMFVATLSASGQARLTFKQLKKVILPDEGETDIFGTMESAGLPMIYSDFNHFGEGLYLWAWGYDVYFKPTEKAKNDNGQTESVNKCTVKLLGDDSYCIYMESSPDIRVHVVFRGTLVYQEYKRGMEKIWDETDPYRNRSKYKTKPIKSLLDFFAEGAYHEEFIPTNAQNGDFVEHIILNYDVINDRGTLDLYYTEYRE